MWGLLILFGGPAGAGKSTLAAAWCATRARAVHLQLDHLRELIVAGRADPQQEGALQGEQYALSVRACCALARVFLCGGYDVAIDDVLEAAAFEAYWRPLLSGSEPRIVILRSCATEYSAFVGIAWRCSPKSLNWWRVPEYGPSKPSPHSFRTKSRGLQGVHLLTDGRSVRNDSR